MTKHSEKICTVLLLTWQRRATIATAPRSDKNPYATFIKNDFKINPICNFYKK
jgi:hypothetical protein